MSEGRIADARESAMAAFQADPTNGDYLVAIALADYALGQDDGVVQIGPLIPLFAPTTTNAWMLFALSRSMVPVVNEPLAKSAFVLAVRLSRSPSATRNYLRRLAEGARKPQVRELIYSALAEEQENPMLFSEVSPIVQGAAHVNAAQPSSAESRVSE